MDHKQVKQLLDDLYFSDNQVPFIADDPIQIPHKYKQLQDIEIVAFWTAMLAWGQRKTIVNKSLELFEMMGDSPYDFIVNLNDEKRRAFSEFKHRTFNYTDTLYFLEYFNQYYNTQETLEDAFLVNGRFEAKPSLTAFHNQFFDLEFAPQRTRKHIATPAKNSACKRISLFLKWMVRKDEKSGDMGVWSRIDKSDLIIPLDVHVMNTVQALKITKESKVNWKLAQEITDYLKVLDTSDPVKYDYSLFIYSRYSDNLNHNM